MGGYGEVPRGHNMGEGNKFLSKVGEICFLCVIVLLLSDLFFCGSVSLKPL